MNAYQFSTMNALMLGHYEAAEKVKDALEHGLVGIGTYEGLNGEAIIIDGCAYNGLPGGEIKQMDVETGMAFGIVAPVQMMGTVFQQKSVLNLVSLKERADEVRKAECKSDNFICFARIDGVFDSVTVRSCHQQNEPYAPMYEVAKSQVETTKNDVEGTLIGFWFPKYMESINLPGWHFHFISADRKTFGGHCLECSLKSGLIGGKKITGLDLRLPEDSSFEKMDFNQDLREKTASVEGKSQKQK